MGWPRNIEYHEAIQNLRQVVSDPELAQGELAMDALGMPVFYSGGFADVYRVHCPKTGNTWAVKCFTKGPATLRERYRLISEHLNRAKLPFTVDFQFVEPGIRVRGQEYPFLKMRWVEGRNLNRFVVDYLDNPTTLKLLLPMWVRLSTLLRKARVAHADLQHGNVLLVPVPEKSSFALRLVDYDGMYVPSLSGQQSGELGHPCYQHPQRLKQGIYNGEVDRFSHLAIYVAIHALSVGGRELWNRFDNGDNLLFREADFREPGNSEALRAVRDLPSLGARRLASHLILATQKSVEQVPLLEEVTSGDEIRPLSSEEQREVERLLSEGVPTPTKETQRDARGRASGTSDTAGEPSAAESPWWVDSTHVVAGITSPLENPESSMVQAEASQGVVDEGGLWQPQESAGLWREQGAPEGASIDGTTGEFVWRIDQDQRPADYVVPVSVETPDGQRDQTDLSISLVPPLKIQRLNSLRVVSGTEGAVDVRLENADWWQGKVSCRLGADAPPGAEIDRRTGRFRWKPPRNQGPGWYDMAVIVEEGASQSDERTLRVEVTKPSPEEIAVDLGGGVTLKMVLIPAGEFLMGSPASEGISEEQPQHKVRITNPYWLGVHEVTVGEYRRFVNDTNRSGGGWEHAFDSQTDDYPVVNVSWLDADAFCKWLSAKEGKTCRLPTEAEWEYACRAGTETKYSFGDNEAELGEYAWYYSNSDKRTHPVGRKKVNPWGLYDMHGNVWEWCQDRYDGSYYAQSPIYDPQGPSSNANRVLRGGSWSDSYARNSRSAVRLWLPPDLRNQVSGFRLARTAEGHETNDE